MKEEIWKPFPRNPNYLVSDNGKVKNATTGHMMSIRENTQGYLATIVQIARKDVTLSIHRAVAETFIPNPFNLPQVNHIDEDKHNNSVDNLEWCYPKYNLMYGSRPKKLSIPVEQLDEDGNVINTFEKMKDVEKLLGIKWQHVSRTCRGISDHAGGYRWRYATEKRKKWEKRSSQS